jgi:hypothetical protein
METVGAPKKWVTPGSEFARNVVSAANRLKATTSFLTRIAPGLIQFVLTPVFSNAF